MSEPATALLRAEGLTKSFVGRRVVDDVPAHPPALAWPAFAVGWILIFFIILRELSASILLYSVGNEVLPVVVMRMWTEGKAGQVSVIALVMLALVFLFRFGERRLVRTHLSAS